jgi:tetratricopeptide (TPR) repeat protein
MRELAHRIPPILATAALFALPPDARAQPSPAQLAEARQRFEVGVQAFDGGDYETAAAEFRRAWELTQHPDLLYNIYLAEERAGRLVEANEALTLYLERAEIDAEQRALLAQRATRLRDRIARAAVEAARTAPAEQAAGESRPVQSRSVEVEGRVEELVRTIYGREIESARAAGRAEASEGIRTAVTALLIGAGVLAASFVLFAILSEIEDQALASECGRDAGRWCSSDRLQTLEIENLIADVSWISATASGGLGLVFFLTLGNGGEAGREIAVVPWIAPRGAGWVLGGRF